MIGWVVLKGVSSLEHLLKTEFFSALMPIYSVLFCYSCFGLLHGLNTDCSEQSSRDALFWLSGFIS